MQETFGYLDDPALTYVAHSLKVPLSKAYGVATFYSLFRLKPEGEHTVSCAWAPPATLRAGQSSLPPLSMLPASSRRRPHADKKVSLLIARCFGACGIAPGGDLRWAGKRPHVSRRCRGKNKGVDRR